MRLGHQAGPDPNLARAADTAGYQLLIPTKMARVSEWRIVLHGRIQFARFGLMQSLEEALNEIDDLPLAGYAIRHLRYLDGPEERGHFTH
jgi:hypothetical protein